MITVSNRQPCIGRNIVILFLAHLVRDDDLAIFNTHTARIFGSGRGLFAQMSQRIALADFRGIFGNDRPVFGDIVLIANHLAMLHMYLAQVAIAVRLHHADNPSDFGDDRFAFRCLSSLK